ncbi:hypothetical protein C1H46_032174 [Malus baccata]|uniref:Uncharacterized protein n=1 Tax=Malus baccata TaxID=106549 RepID=A0A540L717_MALBA|nr:hypothetical protein C1H46_032174 [Malus baccata]
MGQGLSCRKSDEHGLFRAVQFRELDTVEERDPTLSATPPSTTTALLFISSPLTAR